MHHHADMCKSDELQDSYRIVNELMCTNCNYLDVHNQLIYISFVHKMHAPYCI